MKLLCESGLFQSFLDKFSDFVKLFLGCRLEAARDVQDNIVIFLRGVYFFPNLMKTRNPRMLADVETSLLYFSRSSGKRV